MYFVLYIVLILKLIAMERTNDFNVLEWAKKELLSQLKPCPFCGGNDIAIHVPNKEEKQDINCLTCGAKMTKALGVVGLIDSWNERTT